MKRPDARRFIFLSTCLCFSDTRHSNPASIQEAFNVILKYWPPQCADALFLQLIIYDEIDAIQKGVYKELYNFYILVITASLVLTSLTQFGCNRLAVQLTKAYTRKRLASKADLFVLCRSFNVMRVSCGVLLLLSPAISLPFLQNR